MPRSSDAKERFIRTAASLFRQGGYHGVGLNEIIAEANAPKGSFYHHFPGGKDELACHAMAYAAGFMRRKMAGAFEEADSFDAGAQALIARLADWFEQSGWQLGCPITTIALETAPSNTHLTNAARGSFDLWTDEIAEHAIRLGAAGDPRTEAERLLTMIEGAWIMARVRQSRAPFEQIASLYDRTPTGERTAR
ncbi:TetR/AcrR family transcriptional regulator [Oceaniradius stylonematis]|jgi:TetR/AcrR family transcriptional repressor of lmrAB and yxaGH operons|uniref:TetR/AcrR family transcriptional regulator n=1 Tax=Oceaniradius stylonematis TaxID=2184161 RepID=UPI0035CF3A76